GGVAGRVVGGTGEQGRRQQREQEGGTGNRQGHRSSRGLRTKRRDAAGRMARNTSKLPTPALTGTGSQVLSQPGVPCSAASAVYWTTNVRGLPGGAFREGRSPARGRMPGASGRFAELREEAPSLRRSEPRRMADQEGLPGYVGIGPRAGDGA